MGSWSRRLCSIHSHKTPIFSIFHFPSGAAGLQAPRSAASDVISVRQLVFAAAAVWCPGSDPMTPHRLCLHRNTEEWCTNILDPSKLHDTEPDTTNVRISCVKAESPVAPCGHSQRALQPGREYTTYCSVSQTSYTMYHFSKYWALCVPPHCFAVFGASSFSEHFTGAP